MQSLIKISTWSLQQIINPFATWITVTFSELRDKHLNVPPTQKWTTWADVGLSWGFSFKHFFIKFSTSGQGEQLYSFTGSKIQVFEVSQVDRTYTDQL